jgi:acyl transferase domain-containing protein/acyl carrier protein
VSDVTGAPPQTEPNEIHDGLADIVREVVAAAVDLPVAKLDPNERFNRYGLTSLSAAGLIRTLSERLGRPLAPTLVWDHPTTDRLIRFLKGAAGPKASAGAIRPMDEDDEIAIVSMAARLPGAKDPEAFWRLLIDGIDAIGDMPTDRWDVDGLYDPDPNVPGRMSTRWGGYLDQVDRFDPLFFGMSPREAVEADPQQRLILELVWEVLERAGLPPSRLHGSRTGIFMGAMWSEYGQIAAELERIALHSATGRDTGIIANRVSYVLGLTGPSLTVNTACSSSLVAVHLAARSLRAGESTVAVAGGVNLILTPDSTVSMTKFGAMAPDGRSKAFDARANGYVRGEGAGLVLLKPLSRAIADGDEVLALLRGSAVNNDGPSNGLTAPSPDAQRGVLRDAYGTAGIDPAEVDYVEAHGTGTMLGDPIEAGSLGEVLGGAVGRSRPLLVGSAKTNIGHLEAAAGIAGLIKAVLALRHREIPPSLHFLSPNPHIDFPGLNLRVPTEPEPWAETDHPRRAGISSFGFGGTNSHVVIEAFEPARVRVPARPVIPCSTAPPLVFVYSGNGAQWAGMGRDLLAAEPVFRAAVEACDAAFLRQWPEGAAGWRVLEELASDPSRARLSDTRIAQCLMFSIQVGLTALLRSWGYRPDIVTGHSLGEVAAAYAAGILSLEDATRVVFHRSGLQGEVSGGGAMAVVRLSWDDADTLLRDHPEVCVAGANAPSSVTIAGPKAPIAKVTEALMGRGIEVQQVRVDVAYHSPAMDPLQPLLVEALVGLAPRSCDIAFHSTVTGGAIDGADCDAAYWGRNLREPVRFAEVIAGLPDAIYVEISPHPILSPSIVETRAANRSWVLPALRRGEVATDTLSDLLAQLAPQGLKEHPVEVDRSVYILTLSAKTPAALSDLATAYAEDLAGREESELADFCFTANTGRDRFDERLAIVAETRDAMIEKLSALSGARGTVQAGLKPDVSDCDPAEMVARAERGTDTWTDVLNTLAERFVSGIDCDWRLLDRGRPRRRLLIPTYRFQRARFWPVPPRPQTTLATDWAYEIAWTPLAGGLPHPGELTEVLPSADPETAGALGRALDRLAASWARRACASAGGGTGRQRRALEGLVARFQDNDEDDAPDALSAQIAETWPEADAELSVIGSVGAKLSGILEGRIDPIDVLFPDGDMSVLEAVYQRAPFAAGLAERLRQAFKAVAQPGLRVLEIGGGTGGTTAHLLPVLPDSGRYLFTDVSSAFLDRARARFGDHANFRAALLDIERDPADQDIGGDHDVAVAVNVLHATRDLRTTLRHVRATLRPGGVLVLGEITGAPGWLDLVFGTLEGWWRFDDTDLRPESALISADGWRDVLEACGFEGVAGSFDGDRQSLILARASVAHRAIVVEPDVEAVVGCGRIDELLATTPDPLGMPLDAPPSPAAAAQRAYLRSAALDQPDRWAGPVTAEGASYPGEDWVRRFEGGLQGARLRPSVLSDGGGMPVRSDGLYLITGGLGALGMAFAEWLAKRGARHLALLSRHVPNEAVAERLKALRAGGVAVQTIAADVGAAVEMEAVFARLGSGAVPVVGVIHAAGNASAIPAEALAPKLDGGHLLDRLSRTEGVELFLLFSSAASVWGAKGRAAYAAGNAALDAIAATRRAAGYQALSVSWGRFSTRGLLDAEEDTALEAMGLRAMAPDTAFDLAWALTADERSHAVIADVDWDRFRSVYELRGRRALLEELPRATLAAQSKPSVPDNARTAAAGDVFEVVRDIVADTLGYPKSDLPTRLGFFEMGLDSLLAVRMRGRLEEALGRSVPTAMLFSHPSVEALVGWLTEAQLQPQPATASLKPKLRTTSNEDGIAVIGIGCRFPGGIMDTAGFARIVFDGVDAVSEVPSSRWNWRDWSSETPDAPGAIASRWGGFLEHIDQFDAAFFGLSPKDAAFMDPQQRLLLEVAWEAVEQAGLDPTRLSGSRTGVFVGITGSDYAMLSRRGRPEDLEAQAITGQPANTSAGRISFALGLSGPALAIDTACSSSLVAIHQACRAIRTGECDMALAGGVNLVLAPETSVILSRAGMLSPTGRCHGFDASANGFVRAEGAGMVALKPISQAIADGDPVLAVVRGSAVNHDGRASGFTVPNGTAQSAVIRAALDDAGVSGGALAFVEAHGTGTALGDPIEAHALANALAEGRTSPLQIGTVKSNIGHAESAAGVAGFIKAVLALHHRRLPPSLHFKRLNPHIRFDRMPFAIPTTPVDLSGIDGRLLGGVSAFGASGTNAHVVLEAADPLCDTPPAASPEDPAPMIVPLSARTPSALNTLAKSVARSTEHHRAKDVAWTTAGSRAGLPVRGFAIGESGADLARSLADGVDALRVLETPKVAFLFTGQGAQYPGMGKALYQSEPVFRDMLDRCEAVAAPRLGHSLLGAMFGDQGAPSINDTARAQPALFAMGVGLSALLRAWGVRPDVVMGHSVGEFAAAVDAGVIELEAAMDLVVRRGALMQALPDGGGMRAISADEARVAGLLEEQPELSIAALNGPTNTVISGPLAALDRVCALCDAAEIGWRPLAVSHAFHSGLLDPMLDAFEAEAAKLSYAPARVPMISNLTGAPVRDADKAHWDAAYWRRHAREPVRFADGVRAAASLGCRVFLEVGPHPILTPLAAATLDTDAVLVSSLGREGDDRRRMLQAAGRLWQAGVDVDFRATAPHSGGRHVPLSSMPFERKRHWLDWIDTSRNRNRNRSLGASVDETVYEIVWEALALPEHLATGSWRLIGADREFADALGAAGLDLVETTTEVGLAGIIWVADAEVDLAEQAEELDRFVQSSTAPVWLITRLGQNATGSDPVSETGAGLWGLARVLALREQDRWGGVIDLRPGPTVDGAVLAAALGRPRDEDQLAIRDGRLLVPRLVAVKTPLPEPVRVRSDATYLITGGLGGIGLAMAEQLVAAGARHLVLTGRKAHEDHLSPALKIEGVDARVVAVDVADADGMTAMADAVLSGMPPVVGILHAAGVKAGAGFAEVLAPKLRGAEVLDTLSADWPLEVFVLFGSAAAVWGDSGLAAYATANAALDGFAHTRRAAGRPATAIDWARFDVSGMLSDPAAELFDRLGIQPMQMAHAFDMMRRIVGSGRSQTLVASVDWDRFKPVHESHRLRPLLRHVGAIETAAAPVAPLDLPKLPPAPELITTLRRIVADILGLDDIVEVDAERGFFALGLDSFGVVELRRAVETAFKLELPTSVLFEAASAKGLATYLLERSKPTSDGSAVPVAVQSTSEPIAIVGVGCRFPGGVLDLEGLARLVFDGIDAVGDPPESRRNGPLPASITQRQAGYLDHVDRFDADFFGISPREAAQIDPQHRLLLEVAWQAVEHAGWAPGTLRDGRTGVFVGITGTEYAMMARNGGRGDAHGVGGQFLNVAAGRISHTLGLNGPSLAVDTACSSSAMSVHLACQSLRAGECDTALAGGANLILSSTVTEMLRDAKMLSGSARCHTFDEAADGYVRAEGCGMVVLKPLSKARADGDRVLAVIRGSAVNHDGSSSGFTVPNGAAQQAVIRQALRVANVASTEVGYVEAHGTGTALGDPIEMRALDAVYGGGRNAPLQVGSIKTNIGHAEAAAGIAGLLKLVVSLGQRRIPRHLHYKTRNPEITVSEDRVAVTAQDAVWVPLAGRRIAGLSAFGASGTNVHLIVEEAPETERAAALPAFGWLPLSGRRSQDIGDLAAQVLRAPDIMVAAREAAVTRGDARFRVAIPLDGAPQAFPLDALKTLKPVRAGEPRIAFLFTGQGAQYPGMARALYATQPDFRTAFDRCAEAMRGRLGMPLGALMESDRPLVATEQVQPMLFAVGYALSALWRSWGVVPSAVLGHSVGEITAACVAGVMSLEDAAGLIVERGRLMGALPSGGAMLAVMGPEASVQACLAVVGAGVEISARNGPEAFVLSGDQASIDRVAAVLESHGLEGRPLAVSHAFHSRLLEPMLEDLERAAGRVTFAPAQIPVASNLDGQLRTAFTARYWRDQARHAVAFADGIGTLADGGWDVFVEIGPQPVLCDMGRRCVSGTWVPSLRRGQEDSASMQAAAATLWLQGAGIEWAKVTGAESKDRAPLPPYPFRPTRHWLPDPGGSSIDLATASWFAERIDMPGLEAPVHAHRMRPEDVPGLSDSGGLVHVGLHLAFAASALGLQTKTSVEVTDAAFTSALRLDAPKDLRIVRSTVGGAALYSKSEDGAWIAHSEMRITSGGKGGDAHPAFGWTTEPSTSISGQKFYADLEDRGFALGPRLRRVEKIWRRDDELRAALTPEGTGDEPIAFGIPAVLFEVMAQLPVAAYPDRPGAFMVVGWDRLIRSAVPLGDDLCVEVRVDPKTVAGLIRADIVLLTNGSHPLVTIEGAVLTRVSHTQAETAPWIGRMVWEVAGPGLVDTDLAPMRLFPTGPVTTGLAAQLRHEISETGPDGDEIAVILAEVSDGFEAARDADVLATVIETVEALQDHTRVLVVTQGVMAPTGVRDRVAASGGGVWGLAQALHAEYPRLSCRVVDVDFEDAADLARILRAEASDIAVETATAWRHGRRYAARLEPIVDDSGARRFAPDGSGSAHWTPDSPRVPAPDEVRIEVAVAAFNFRDALVMHGRVAPTLGFGAECSGVIREIGDLVTGLAVGDAVVAYIPDGAGAVASSVTVSAAMVRPKPPRLGFAGAAAFPVSAMVAWHGLVDRAHLKSGEVVLVHAAGSGVGLAAASVARHLGARVVATASHGKHATLRTLGVEVIGDSRLDGFGPEFQGALAKLGSGKNLGSGIDVAIGAFDEGARAAVSAGLNKGGRIVDLTKHGNCADIDLDALARDQQAMFATAFDTVMARISDGSLSPLPYEVLERRDAIDGLRRIASGSVVGRLCVAVQDIPDTWSGTWLITGAAGGIGRVLIDHLVGKGVRSFVLIDRSDLPTEIRTTLAEAGSEFISSTADVSDEATLSSVMKQAADALPPIQGVLHTAAVTDDAPLRALDRARFAKVLAPKVGGAWVLDRVTTGLPVRVFCVFSSVVATLPSASQGAYAAANAALDQFARHRRMRGLPAVSIQWGPWDIGIGATMGARNRKVWREWGVTPMTRDQGMAVLDRLINGAGDRMAIGMDWTRYSARSGRLPNLFERVCVERAPRAEPAETLPQGARPESPPDDPNDMDAVVRNAAAHVLGLPPGVGIDPDRSFNEQGMDSLMATDLSAELSRRLGRKLPGTLAYNFPTLQALSAHLSGLSVRARSSDPIPDKAAVVSDETSGETEADLLAALNARLAEIDDLLGDDQ